MQRLTRALPVGAHLCAEMEQETRGAQPYLLFTCARAQTHTREHLWGTIAQCGALVNAAACVIASLLRRAAPRRQFYATLCVRECKTPRICRWGPQKHGCAFIVAATDEIVAAQLRRRQRTNVGALFANSI